MPPKECKVVREYLPHEQHLLNLYEKKERLKALKSKQEVSRSARYIGKNSPNDITNYSTTEASKIDFKVEQLLNTKLDKLIRPEASNYGQLDLNKSELHVKNNFSVERAKRLH